jgi:uncharacterized protein
LQSLAARRTGNFAITMNFARRSCDAGTAAACSLTGELFLNEQRGLVDNRLAATYFKKGCDLNNANSCHAIGLMLMQGIGVTAEMRSGRLALQKSCNLGNAMGCTNLASIVSSGVYGPVDCRLAQSLYGRAIELWPDNAQAKMGLEEAVRGGC